MASIQKFVAAFNFGNFALKILTPRKCLITDLDASDDGLEMRLFDEFDFDLVKLTPPVSNQLPNAANRHFLYVLKDLACSGNSTLVEVDTSSLHRQRVIPQD